MKLCSEPAAPMMESLSEILGHRGATAILILTALSGGAKRFGALKQQLGHMSQKTLVSNLRSLEHAGLLNRTVYAEIPPRVEYSLTEAGQSLRPVLHALDDWHMCRHKLR